MTVTCNNNNISIYKKVVDDYFDFIDNVDTKCR